VSASPAPFKRILVPVDFSERAAGALQFAVALGSKNHAEIEVLHVWHSDLATPVTGARDRAKGALRDFVSGLGLRGDVELRRRTEHGDPYLTIQSLVQLSRYDLLVLAGPEARRAQPGSVTNALLGAAPIPVLLVPPHCKARFRSDQERILKWERILVPLTLAGDDLQALTQAESLANADAAAIEILLSSDTTPQRLSCFRARASSANVQELSTPEPVTLSVSKRVQTSPFDLVLMAAKRGRAGERPGDGRALEVAGAIACPSLTLPD